MTLKTSFEKQPCTRCNGSGRYSFCQAYGYTCFKCKGSGETLTLKGEVANNYYVSSRKVSVKSLSVGDFFREDRSSREIINVELQTNSAGFEMVEFETKGGRTYSFNSELEVIKIFSKEDNQELIKAALEYQSKLTKKGELMKKYL